MKHISNSKEDNSFKLENDNNNEDLLDKNEENKKKKKEKKKKCWVIISPNKGINEIDLFILILEVLSIVPSVLIFLYSQKIYFDGEVTRAIALDLYDNLNTGFFSNFSDCSEYNEFNFLFEPNKDDKNSEEKEENEIPLSFGEWQGTVQACINVNNKIRVLDPGKTCTADERLIDRIPSVKFYKYKGLKICALSDDTLSYYDLLQKPGSIISKFEECPENKKSCGYIDTLKNILCIDLNSECPVNYVKVSKIPPIEPIGDLKEISSEQITFYYSKNPYPNSTKIPYIVNSFKIADSQICALPNLYYSEIILNDLEASKKNYSTNCVLKDFSQRQTVDLMRYHKLDLIDNYNLYEENEIIKKIKQKELDKYGFDFERYKNHSLYLYVRNHYGFNYTCLEEREKKSQYTTLEEIQSSYSRADIMFAWAQLIFGLNFVPTISAITNAITFLDDKAIFEIIIKQLITFGFTTFDFVFTLIKKSLDDPFEDKMECSDIVTNDEFNVMNEKIRHSGQNMSYTFRCMIIQIVIHFLIIIWTIFKYLYLNNHFDCCEGCCKCCCKCCICECCICCPKNNVDGNAIIEEHPNENQDDREKINIDNKIKINENQNIINNDNNKEEEEEKDENKQK